MLRRAKSFLVRAFNLVVVDYGFFGFEAAFQNSRLSFFFSISECNL